MMLSAMLLQHVPPLEWAMNTGLFDIKGALVGLLAALLALFLSRHLFDYRKPRSQVAFGLIFGGIVGNLIDRLQVGHVIDFIYFYAERGGRELGFPAFNVADSAICTGVGLVFLITWLNDRQAKRATAAPAKSAAE